MYDCSTDSYEDNVKKVKEMADIAHSYGATIEGELGHVGDNPDSASRRFPDRTYILIEILKNENRFHIDTSLECAII